MNPFYEMINDSYILTPWGPVQDVLPQTWCLYPYDRLMVVMKEGKSIILTYLGRHICIQIDTCDIMSKNALDQYQWTQARHACLAVSEHLSLEACVRIKVAPCHINNEPMIIDYTGTANICAQCFVIYAGYVVFSRSYSTQTKLCLY